MTRRKIHIGGDVWEYKVFKTRTVCIWTPEGKKIVADTCKLKDLDWDAIERGAWKRTNDGTIFPSEVKAYIETYCIVRAPRTEDFHGTRANNHCLRT